MSPELDQLELRPRPGPATQPTDEEREVLPMVKKTGIGRWVFIVVQAVGPRKSSAC